MKTILLVAITIFTFNLCKPTQKNYKTLYISANTRPCHAGVMQKECMLVKKSKTQKDWENFYNEIVGFNYEKGNEYEIVVKIDSVNNPPADGSSLAYTLVKINSKIK